MTDGWAQAITRGAGLAPMESALLWLGIFVWLGLVATKVALTDDLPRQKKWILFALIASSPLFCPSRGVLSTLVTGIAVVLSVRLTDVDRERQRKKGFELGLWLVLPMLGGAARSDEERQHLRRRAGFVAFKGVLKYGAWLLIKWAVAPLDPSLWPWPARSALLMLYFVLLITALADALCALCLAAGAWIEPLFDAPLLSRSIRDFWSRRWNRFISRFALRHVSLRFFSPSERVSWKALVAVFATSGLFHEYFAWGVSGTSAVPGSMMLFFLLQALALLISQRVPLPTQTPNALRILLTATWMALTSPLFFESIRPPLLELGYPEDWMVSLLPLAPS